MSLPTAHLDFSVVDDLAFAAEHRGLNHLRPTVAYVPESLGPLIELWLLASGGHLPDTAIGWLSPKNAARFLDALRSRQEQWIGPDGRIGFVRAVRRSANADENYTAFLMTAKRAAAQSAGFGGSAPGQLAAAMWEMENNIHEHSEAAETGILCFRAASGLFEFVVADGGIGILNSLRTCTTFSSLHDHGRALECAIAEGTSRHGVGIGRGFGFRQIFLSLLDMRGALRFRSGDHALLLDGIGPNEKTAQLAQKPNMKGFFAWVCATRPSKVSGRVTVPA